MASVLPASLGRYEVLEELGKGAMGVVYLARDPLIGRLVALKTFRASQAMHGTELLEYRARFMREAQSAGILSHRHIVTIHDVVDGVETNGITFIAMEYVRGTNLKELLLSGEPFPLDRVVDVVSQVAEALDYAHSKGVIHRDIKPANIIIEQGGGVKITDFGIARLEESDLTHEGQLLGTPNYMAPERILGHKVDHRTDIFSLGVVLYEMLTRQKPFQGENLTMVSHRIVYEPFVPPKQYVPGLPPGVVAVLEKALQKNPEERFASAGELSRALRTAAGTATNSETTVVARPTLTPPGLIASATPTPPAGTPVAPTTTPPGGIAAMPPPPPPSMPPPPPHPARRQDAAATQDVSGAVAPVRAAAAARASGARGPSTGRLVAVAAVAGALALLLVAGGYAWLRRQAPPPPKVDPTVEQRQADAGRLLQAARADLDAGRTDAALADVERGLAIAPDDPHLLKMKQRVQQAMATKQTVVQQQAQLSALLTAGEAALQSGNPEQALDLGRQVLALVPADARATALVTQAQTAVDRAAKKKTPLPAARTAATTPPVAARATTATHDGAAGAATSAAAGPAMLRIDFFTELPEGVLTIYADTEQILGEPFKFYKRTGMFHSEAKAGRIEAARQVHSGAVTLRVYVALPKQAPIVRTVQTQLTADANRTLKIYFDKSQQLTVGLQ